MQPANVEQKPLTGLNSAEAGPQQLQEENALLLEQLESYQAEKDRLGQDLHDVVGQELTSLCLLAENLIDDCEGSTRKTASVLHEGLRRVLRTVRDLSHGLLSAQIQPEALIPALADLSTNTAELHRVDCTFECDPRVRLQDSNAATQLYYIAREALTNALNHGKAKKITLQLGIRGPDYVLCVEDDGLGLAPLEPGRRGMGLRILNHRANLIDAQLVIAPADKGGTLVTCRFPRWGRYSQRLRKDEGDDR